MELTLATMSNADVAPPGEHAHGTVSTPVARTVAPYRALPTTPASEFDLALLVPDGVSAAEVEQVIRAAAGELLERLVAFDQFTGSGVLAGHRSVAWRLTLRHPERTLRDKEIDGRRAKILAALQQELHVRQRST
jgi:phenylalanyl-tRNA synthetase beta chain